MARFALAALFDLKLLKDVRGVALGHRQRRECDLGVVAARTDGRNRDNRVDCVFLRPPPCAAGAVRARWRLPGALCPAYKEVVVGRIAAREGVAGANAPVRSTGVPVEHGAGATALLPGWPGAASAAGLGIEPIEVGARGEARVAVLGAADVETLGPPRRPAGGCSPSVSLFWTDLEATAHPNELARQTLGLIRKTRTYHPSTVSHADVVNPFVFMSPLLECSNVD